MARRGLTRDAVLAAAGALADDQGIDALTMRALAHSVGVEAMSLYHHVPNKEALLAANARAKAAPKGLLLIIRRTDPLPPHAGEEEQDEHGAVARTNAPEEGMASHLSDSFAAPVLQSAGARKPAHIQ